MIRRTKAAVHRGGKRMRHIFGASTPLRFIIVGGFNTLSSYLVYLLLLLAARLPFPVANLGSILFGVALGFVTQGRIVFGDSDNRNILPFAASWLLIYLGQLGSIWLLIRNGIAASIAGLIVLPLVVVTSFLVQKFFVFNRRRSTDVVRD